MQYFLFIYFNNVELGFVFYKVIIYECQSRAIKLYCIAHIQISTIISRHGRAYVCCL